VDALAESLWGYSALMYLHLDNNPLGDRGAQLLAGVLGSTRVHLLDVGFGRIGGAGMAALLAAVASHPTLQVLTLSGNRLDMDVGHHVASAVGRNDVLRELYLDHTEMSQLGQCQITTALVNNPALGLRKITGFGLGLVAAQVRVPSLVHHAAAAHDHALRQLRGGGGEGGAWRGGGDHRTYVPPPTIEACPNELVLQYIRELWHDHHQAVRSQAAEASADHVEAALMSSSSSSAEVAGPLRPPATEAERVFDGVFDGLFGDEVALLGLPSSGSFAAAAAAASILNSSHDLLGALEPRAAHGVRPGEQVSGDRGRGGGEARDEHAHRVKVRDSGSWCDSTLVLRLAEIARLPFDPAALSELYRCATQEEAPPLFVA
jgi:hypothetical protein